MAQVCCCLNSFADFDAFDKIKVSAILKVKKKLPVFKISEYFEETNLLYEDEFGGS